jgi:hypothetical protein
MHLLNKKHFIQLKGRMFRVVRICGFNLSKFSQREIEELKAEVAELKQSPDYQHVQVQTDEE